MPRTRFLAAILDGGAKPNMRWRRSFCVTRVDVVAKTRAAFRQNLEFVPVRLFHGVENAIDELEGDFLVEEIAHRIDEDHLWFAPPQRLIQPLWTKLEVEAIFKGVSGDPAEPLREALGVAVIAASADFRATRHRVPRRVGPFDLRSRCHSPL